MKLKAPVPDIDIDIDWLQEALCNHCPLENCKGNPKCNDCIFMDYEGYEEVFLIWLKNKCETLLRSRQ